MTFDSSFLFLTGNFSSTEPEEVAFLTRFAELSYRGCNKDRFEVGAEPRLRKGIMVVWWASKHWMEVGPCIETFGMIRRMPRILRPLRSERFLWILFCL